MSSLSVVDDDDASGNGSMLPFVNDSHGGVMVEINNPMDRETFSVTLKSSLSYWKEKGKRGVWIKLPIRLANLVEIVVKEGFSYHHAEPSYLMLVHWIPETVCTLPANASHRVGVGAVVMNDKRELLVVQEKSGHFRGTGVWKIPTGVVDEGEDISVAAMREVKEETGVDTEFLEILAFRQSHKSYFEKSDLFFLCMMRPLSFDIYKQDLEIEAAQWMPIEEFEAQPIVKKHMLFQYIIDLCIASVEKKYEGFSRLPLGSPFGETKMSFLYANAKSGIEKTHAAVGDV